MLLLVRESDYQADVEADNYTSTVPDVRNRSFLSTAAAAELQVRRGTGGVAG
jgi:hypothetical protein